MSAALLQGCTTKYKQATEANHRRRPAGRGRFDGSGAPDSDRTGLADPPEDWPTSSPRDAAAVTPHDLQLREARCDSNN